jgi:hypothetical protein
MAAVPKNAPQGGGTDHAQGAHRQNIGGFDIPQTVGDVNLPSDADNRVANIDIRTIAPDRNADNDYDDSYPGGPAPGLPGVDVGGVPV